MPLKDFVDEDMFSNFSTTSTIVTIAHDMGDGAVTVEQNVVPPQRPNPRRAMPAAKAVRITHIHDQNLHTCSQQFTVRMVQSSDTFVKRDNRNTHFHENYFWRNSK